jgi:hypothetical protein
MLSLLKFYRMKKRVTALLFTFLFLLFFVYISSAQCSICTKTAQQLGEGPAKGLNAGIIYLAFAPFAIVGFVAFRWWKSNRKAV